MDSHECYLKDLSGLLIEQAREAKEARDKATNEGDKLFESGRLLGYYSVISLMQQQAQAFGVELDAIGLAGIHPDRDLL